MIVPFLVMKALRHNPCEFTQKKFSSFWPLILHLPGMGAESAPPPKSKLDLGHPKYWG